MSQHDNRSLKANIENGNVGNCDGRYFWEVCVIEKPVAMGQPLSSKLGRNHHVVWTVSMRFTTGRTSRLLG